MTHNHLKHYTNMKKNTFSLDDLRLDFNFNDLQHDLTTKSREVWLASLGALATVQEESGKLYDTFAKTGVEIKDQAVALQRRVMNLPEEAQDLLKEGENYAENLMDKGEALEKDLRTQAKKLEQAGTKQFNSFVSELQAKGNEWQDQITNAISNPIENVSAKVSATMNTEMIAPMQNRINTWIHAFGVPTHQEIQALHTKVEILTEKVEHLANVMATQKASKTATETVSKKATKTVKA